MMMQLLLVYGTEQRHEICSFKCYLNVKYHFVLLRQSIYD